jgi:hypothetical protein
MTPPALIDTAGNRRLPDHSDAAKNQICTSARLIHAKPTSAPPYALGCLIGSAATVRDCGGSLPDSPGPVAFVPRADTRSGRLPPLTWELSPARHGERDRTADLPFTRSTAPCAVRASCSDSTRHRTDGARCAGSIQSAVPRNVPHGWQAMVHGRN